MRRSLSEFYREYDLDAVALIQEHILPFPEGLLGGEDDD
jgi:hypothetical protein